MNAKELRDNLTLENYEQIFHALGVGEIKKTENYWMLPTLCHNLDISSASYKLYFYLDSKTTFCFTECQKSRDIFDLIADRWKLEGRDNFTFPQIIKYICNVCGFKSDDNGTIGITTQPAWKKRLAVYKTTKKSLYLGKRYDKDILQYLTPFFHSAFLNDGISKETMEKFGIAYYAPNNEITIPVYDLDGELIGIHCRCLNPNAVKRHKYIPLKTVSGLDYRFKAHEVLYGMNMNLPMIEQRKQIQLFESPKSVLQMDTMYDNHNTAVGMFGMNLGKQRAEMIMRARVSEVIIGIDKDYESVEDEKFEAYISNVRKIARLFRGYCRCSVLFDEDNLLGLKDSPTDKGRDVYEHLLNNRKVVEV